MRIRYLPPLLLCLLAGAQGATIDPLTYKAVACGGAYGPCEFTPFERTPSADDLAGLTSDLFRDFFIAQGIPVGSGMFSWTARGSNDNGYVFGSVRGSNMIATQFVYRHDLLCCTTDEPFFLYGINDNNLLVGFTPRPSITLGGFLGLASMMNADQNYIPLNIIPDPRIGRPLLFYFFAGIDDHNDILARPRDSSTPSYILYPLLGHQSFAVSDQGTATRTTASTDTAVPEPAALWLVLVGVVIYGARFPFRNACG